MWISNKKWNMLEKRIADLEEQVQGQLKVEFDAELLNRQIRGCIPQDKFYALSLEAKR